jgi:hypothetical protein
MDATLGEEAAERLEEKDAILVATRHSQESPLTGPSLSPSPGEEE